VSAQLPGIPMGPELKEPGRRKVFTHVPKLHELIANGGWPGVVYAQVCIHNLMLARERAEKPANLRPIRDSVPYSISGPLGEVGMALVGCGKPIIGAAPEAGARLFFTDGEVGKETGLEVAFPIWFRPQEVTSGEEIPVSQGTSGARQGPQGDVRVQVGVPAQRKQQRPQGDQPQTSGSDSAEREPKA